MFKTLGNPGMFRTMVYLESLIHFFIQNEKHIQKPSVFTSLEYSKTPYIQNAGIFKIRGSFRTLSNIYDEAFGKNSEQL